MAHGSAALELDKLETPKQDVPFKVKSANIGNPPPGSTVILKGNFEADFDSGRPEDEERGWDKDHSMTLTGDSFEVTVPNLSVGAKYAFKILVRLSNGTETWYPRGKNQETIIRAEPEKSPSPIATTKDVRERMRKKVVSILDAGTSHEKAETLDALFEQLRVEMDTLKITEDQSSFMVSVILEAMSEDNNLPKVMRQHFAQGQKSPTTFAELEHEFERASILYGEKMYQALRADPSARKFFKLDKRPRYNSLDPIGDERHNALFEQMRRTHDLSAMTPSLEAAFESVVNVPARRPDLDDQRLVHLEHILERLSPAKQSALAKIPAHRQAQLTELAVQAGLLGVGAVSLPAGLAVWFMKGLGEGVSGVHIADITQARKTRDYKGLWKTFKRENVLSKWLYEDVSLWESTKKGVKEWLKRSIPVVGPLKWGGKPAKAPAPKAGVSQPEPQPVGSAEDFIRKAAQVAAS